jgi:hypothetical protein
MKERLNLILDYITNKKDNEEELINKITEEDFQIKSVDAVSLVIFIFSKYYKKGPESILLLIF